MENFILYLLRWQLSTPVLWLCLKFAKTDNKMIVTIIANLIGGIMFFWVDKWIFS